MFLFLLNLEPLGTRGFHNVLFMEEAERKGTRQKLYTALYMNQFHTLNIVANVTHSHSWDLEMWGVWFKPPQAKCFFWSSRFSLTELSASAPARFLSFPRVSQHRMDEGGWWMQFVLLHTEICELFFFFLSYSSFIQSPCSCVCFCLSLWMRMHEERISHKQCKLLCLRKSHSCVHLDPAVSLYSCFSLEQLSGQWQNQLSFPWSGVKRVGIWADVHFCASSCLIFEWNVQKAEIRGLEILQLVKLNCGAGPFSEMSFQDLWKMWELCYISVLKWLHIKQSNHHYQSSLPPSKI